MDFIHDIFGPCSMGVLFVQRAVSLIDGFQFFSIKREMSILLYYGEFYENTAKNRFYPILSSLDVVF